VPLHGQTWMGLTEKIAES